MNRNKDHPLVSVVIVNWNERKLLEKCLESIAGGTDYPSFNVIVVDNGSTDGSPEMVHSSFPWVRVIENKANLGYAKANNQGIRRAMQERADYIFLLNNDTKVIHSDWLTKMVEIPECCPEVGIVGCKLTYPDGRIQHAGGKISATSISGTSELKPDHRTGDEIKDVDYVVGAALMVKREVVRRIGLIDERFHPAFYEEIDYCVRARMAGYNVIYNPRTVIFHHGSITVKKSISKTERAFSWHKNRLAFMLLNFPLEWLLRRPKYELELVISSLIERKDEARELCLSNTKIRADWHLNLAVFAKAYLENLRSMKELLQERKCRRAKVGY